ncbi:MAG: proton-conducting transporter membrane subunit, partial [Deltaproteobacteria bacterium]|nr:proton-conducting transporter membrane subunit [Deltaproteobacteria bacterium]
TILLSGMLALAQDNLKRRLAFSTINNLAIIIFGAALLSPSGITGGIFHIAAHGFMKITLFFVAGAIYVKTHKENVSELDGIGKSMPVTMASFAVASLGIAGIPPMAGFITKWYLCLGSLEAKEIIFLFVLLASALLDIAYFAPIIYRSFFKKPPEQTHFGLSEASLWMVIPIAVCATISIILGIFPNGFFHFFEIATLAAKSVLGIN